MKIEARLGGGLISDGSFKRGVDLKGMTKRLSELVVIFICMFLISIKRLKSCIKKIWLNSYWIFHAKRNWNPVLKNTNKLKP